MPRTKSTLVLGSALAALTALAACDVAYPVTVLGPDGAKFRGTASNTFLEGGSFHATNGNAVCSGTYRQHSDIKTVSFPVTCNNGLTGIGTASFESAKTGHGTVTMSDGSSWKFLFGNAALLL